MYFHVKMHQNIYKFHFMVASNKLIFVDRAIVNKLELHNSSDNRSSNSKYVIILLINK